MNEFDELTQYVVIEHGVQVVKQLEITDVPIENVPSGDFTPYIPEPTLAEQNRADIDYIAIMMEVEL